MDTYIEVVAVTIKDVGGREIPVRLRIETASPLMLSSIEAITLDRAAEILAQDNPDSLSATPEAKP